MDVFVAAAGTLLFGSWFIRFALFPYQVIEQRDRAIRQRGLRASTRIAILQSGVGSLTLAILTAVLTSSTLWCVVAVFLGLLFAASILGYWLMEDSVEPPVRTPEVLKLNASRKRLRSLLPLILLVCWLNTWLANLS